MSSKSGPGRDGGRPLVGRASEFQPLHCGVRRLHFSARRAAPGTRIVEKLGIQTKDFIGSLLLTLSCPFLPPAPCLASPFLSTDVAKRADGTRSRGRRAVFFRSLAFLSWGRGCNRVAGNRQGANDGATRTAANRHARHVRRFLGRERGNYHEQEKQGGIRRPRAQVQQSSREPPTAVSRVPPPPHVRILAKFIRLLPLASYCVDATERRARKINFRR